MKVKPKPKCRSLPNAPFSDAHAGTSTCTFLKVGGYWSTRETHTNMEISYKLYTERPPCRTGKNLEESTCNKKIAITNVSHIKYVSSITFSISQLIPGSSCVPFIHSTGIRTDYAASPQLAPSRVLSKLKRIKCASLWLPSFSVPLLILIMTLSPLL